MTLADDRILVTANPRRVLLRLDVANAEGASVDRRKVLPDPDGRFRFDGVRPGAGTLAVTVDAEGSRREARVGNLVIAPGGTTTDPRLDPWDLRELVEVRRITVTLVDQHGAPVPDGLVTILDQGLPELSHFFDGPFPVDTDGRRELVFRGPTCLLLVSAFGYADRSVQGADRDLCLTLSPTQRVRIQVPGSARRLPEGVVFVLDFERGRYKSEIDEAEEHSREAEPQVPSVTVFGDPHDVVLDPEGEAAVTFPSAGPWIVAIRCQDLVRDRVFYAEDLGLPEAVNWTLEPGATFSRIAIPHPAGDLGEIIRRLREEDR